MCLYYIIVASIRTYHQRPATIGLALLVAAGFCSCDSHDADAGEAKQAQFAFDPDEYGVPLPVTFNGRATTFLLDTACSLSAFDKSFREELGEAVRSMKMHSADGTVAVVEVFRTPRAHVGGIRLSDDAPEVACIDFAQHRAALGRAVFGVIGMDFLISRVVQINFESGAVAILRSLPEDSGTEVQMGLTRMNIPVVPVDIAGLGRQMFLLGTGSFGPSSGLVDAELLRSLIGSGNAVVTGHDISLGAFKLSKTRRATLAKITIGDHEHRNLSFSESSANVLGLECLSRYTLTFDFPHMKLYLKPGRRFNEPSVNNNFGAVICRAQGVTTVSTLFPRSNADLAGLRTGDVIECLDGHPVKTMSLRRIRERLSAVDRHVLRVRRGIKSHEILVDVQEQPGAGP